jgi:hypothetical protein
MTNNKLSYQVGAKIQCPDKKLQKISLQERYAPQN